MFDPSQLGGMGAGMGAGAPPAPSISLPGAPEEAPPQESSSSDPLELMRQALETTRKAAAAEPDDEDQAMLEKIGADISKYIAAQQKLTDSAMGAGPGVKLVRKAAGNSGAGY